MIKHVVMWKFKENEKKENLRKAIEMLEDMRENIEVIEDLNVGTDFGGSLASYDIALIVTLRSKADLQVYRDHPVHKKVAEFIGKVRDKRAVVDFEE